MIPNTTFETAAIISSLPFNTTLSPTDSGVTYTLFYKYSPIKFEYISVFGYSAQYVPMTTVYLLIDGDLERLPDDMYNPYSDNVPITVPVEPGNIYVFEFWYSGIVIPAALITIDIIKHIPQDYPDESLMIPDDTFGFAGAILSPTTGEVLKFINGFPAGEEGDSLTVTEGGQILVEDYNSEFLRLYDKNLVLLNSIAYSGLPSGRIGDITAVHSDNSKFYVGWKGSGPTPASFLSISKTGIIGSTLYIMPFAGMTSLAINKDETIAYISGQSSSDNPNIIQWDLVNNVRLSDFTPSVTGGSIRVYVMKNDNIVVTTYNSGPNTSTVSEYDSSHNLLHSYNFGQTSSGTFGIRLKHATENPNTVWCWVDNIGANSGKSTFIKLRLSDGVHLQEFTVTQYEGGQSQDVISATPEDRFGHSFSCPLLILYQGGTAEGGDDGGGPEPDVPVGTGIYFINPLKTAQHDSYYGPVEKKIPNPTIKTAILGE